LAQALRLRSGLQGGNSSWGLLRQLSPMQKERRRPTSVPHIDTSCDASLGFEQTSPGSPMASERAPHSTRAGSVDTQGSFTTQQSSVAQLSGFPSTDRITAGRGYMDTAGGPVLLPPRHSREGSPLPRRSSTETVSSSKEEPAPGMTNSISKESNGFGPASNGLSATYAAAAAAGLQWGFEEEVRFELQKLNSKLDQMLKKSGRDRAPSMPLPGVMRQTSAASNKPQALTGANSTRGNEIRRISEDADVKRSLWTDVLFAPPTTGATKKWEPQRTISAGDVSDVQTIASPSGGPREDPPPPSSTPGANHIGISIGEPTRQISAGSMCPSTTTVDNRMEAFRQKQMKMSDIIQHHHRHNIFPVLDKVWRFIEYYDSSYPARVFNRLMPIFILSSVAFTLSQSVDNPPLDGVAAAVVETTIDSLYGTLLMVRFAACPSQQAFLHNLFNVIDILTVVPIFVRASAGFVLPSGTPADWKHRFLLFYVPVIRLMKTMRRFEKLHLLLRAFKVALDALPVLLYLLCCLALSFSVLICLAEENDNPDMQSLPECLWFTIVTMFTVGYGDLTPQTWEGKAITSMLIIATMLYMAVPVGIIGNAFNQTWRDRDRLLLMKKTRDRLRQWGYQASDIPTLFQCSDSNDDGELTITEFRALIQRLQLGFSNERILQLFTSFDVNYSGTIDDREFIRALFPHAFYEMYHEVDEPQQFEGAGRLTLRRLT